MPDPTNVHERNVVWRFRLGGFLFFLGLIFPLFIPLALMIDMSTGMKAAVTGMMAVAR